MEQLFPKWNRLIILRKIRINMHLCYFDCITSNNTNNIIIKLKLKMEQWNTLSLFHFRKSCSIIILR